MCLFPIGCQVEIIYFNNGGEPLQKPFSNETGPKFKIRQRQPSLPQSLTTRISYSQYTLWPKLTLALFWFVDKSVPQGTKSGVDIFISTSTGLEFTFLKNVLLSSLYRSKPYP